MTESDETGAQRATWDWRAWNGLLALVALLLDCAAVALAYDGVGGWWPLRLAVAGTTFALAASNVARNQGRWPWFSRP